MVFADKTTTGRSLALCICHCLASGGPSSSAAATYGYGHGLFLTPFEPLTPSPLSRVTKDLVKIMRLPSLKLRDAIGFAVAQRCT